MVKEYLPEARNQGQGGLVLPKAVYSIGQQGAPGAPYPVSGILPQAVYDIAPMPEEPETGVIASVKRGAGNTFASLSNLVGQEEWAMSAQEYASQFPKEVPDIQSVKDLGDLGTFAVEAAAENVTNMLLIGAGALLTGATAGAPIWGAAGVNFALQAGESKAAIQEEGGDVNLLSVGTPAAMNTFMDTFSLLKIAQKANVLGKVVKHLDESAEVSGLGGRLKEGAKAGAFAFGVEGSTEVVQNYNNMVFARLSADQEFKDAVQLTGQDADELINAFAAGALGAAVTAAPTAAVFAKTKTGGTTAIEEPDAAPVQDTEVDNDPLTGQEPRARQPRTPDEDAPNIDETPVSTQEAGDADEPTQVSNTPLNDVEALQTEIETLKKYLEEGAPDYVPLHDRIMGGVTLPRKDQVPVTDPQGSGGFQQLPMSWASFNTQKPDGTYSTLFENFTVELPATNVSLEMEKLLDQKSLKPMIEMAESMRKQFLPDAPVVLVSPKQMGIKGNTAGAMVGFEIEGRRAYAVSLNPKTLETLYANDYADNPEGRVQLKEAIAAGMADTLAHEMGHVHTFENYMQAESKVKNALLTEYQAWLDKAKTQTFKQFVENRFGPTSAAYYLKNVPKEYHNENFLEFSQNKLKWTRESLRYYLSFEEFTAENMAKFAARDSSIRTRLMENETKSFWRSIYDTFQQLFREFKKSFASPVKFTAWTQSVRQQNALNALMQIPTESARIQQSVMEVYDGDIGKFRDALNLPIENAIRFTDNVGTILDDAKQLEALKRNHRVSTGFTRMWGGTFLTPAQIAERYNIPEAKLYMERVYDYHQTKMKGIQEADAVSKDWMRLPQAQADNLGRFLYAVSEKSDKENRRLNAEEIADMREKYGVNDDMYRIYQNMDGTFGEILGRLEQSLVKDVARQYTNNPDAFTQEYLATSDPLERASILTSYGITEITTVMTKLKNIQDSFRQLRNRNYFPRMRFGSYTITVKKKRVVEGKLKQTTAEFLTFESKKERDKVMKEYEKDYADQIRKGEVDMQASKLDDTTRALYGMPQLVIDRIASTLRDVEGVGLTPDQEKAITDISLDLSPGKRYLRHMQKRKNTKGFSTEAMRTYAAYMSNASNHLARVEHTQDMTAALRDLRAVQKEAQGDVTDLAELESYYTDHFKYLLNPESDWAKLRAFGFLWYLGFNVKSALVNTTQLPMVTYPYLAARYGDKAATASLAKAMKDVTSHMAQRKKYANEAEQRLMDKLLQEGVIDESMVSDLAGLAEGTALQRIMPTNRAHRVVNDINYYGGYMFGIAEKYNRQVTALSTFREHMKVSDDFDASYRAAKDAIHKSQFEYAKYNRPEFMRGKKSAFFLFYNYTQQFLYLAFAGGKTKQDKQTAVRMWVMLLALAGLQGLPFAEYLFSVIDMLGTQGKKLLGMDNPKVNIRRDIRELLDDLGANPDLVMHGAGRFLGAGPLKLLEVFGAPVPNLDITGSLGMGEPLPGFRSQNLQGTPQEMAGQILLNGLGPIPNIALEMWNGVSSSDPDGWKRFEKALPVFGKNISKATRFYLREGETTRGGAVFLPYDGNDPYEMGEIIAQGLGFSGTRLSQKRSIYGEQMGTALYWSERRQLMMERYAYAVKTGDVAAKREALEGIREYNAALTAKELKPYRISNANLKASLKSKLRTLSLREKGIPTRDRDRLIYSAVEESY